MNRGIMILFLTYFMLLTDDLFKRKLVEIVGPTLARKKITVKLLEDIAGQIERFLSDSGRYQRVVAVVTGLALWCDGTGGRGLLGICRRRVEFHSLLRPADCHRAGWATAAFLQFGTLAMTAAVAGVALLITALEGWF